MVDPGSLVVAFTGVDIAVIGFLMYRYAGEMEPAPFEGTIYEHASRRAREEAYRLTGILLGLTGLASIVTSLLFGPMPGFYVTVAGTVFSTAVYFTVLRRRAEEYLLEEPLPETGPEEGIPLEPPGLPVRLLSGIASLVQAPLLWNTLYYYLGPDTPIIIAIWLVAELPVLVTLCMTLCWPEAYANPCLTGRLYKFMVVVAPPAASLFPLGIHALLQEASPWPGVALIIAGVVLLSVPALLCISRKTLKITH
ncbi:MAG: hypothetical protein F7C33_05205 [Desulfurococcales archaeon]|nr:hypothetical protein [Desulfurococcales archaeon]